MDIDCSYPIKNIGLYPQLIEDYLSQKDHLKPYYGLFPSIENINLQIQKKADAWKNQSEKRHVLQQVLKRQHKNLDVPKTLANIDALTLENTFTVTTGHQLCIATGPLYVVYKILETIQLSKKIAEEYPDFNIVPVFWMATEDHDFEEINHLWLNEQKTVWNRESGGPVGRLSTDGIASTLQQYALHLNTTESEKAMLEMMLNAYESAQDLADATRRIALQLFPNSGLICLDGDDEELKQFMLKDAEADLTQHLAHQHVNNLIKQWKGKYKAQVQAREINLFYIDKNYRERIVYQNDSYHTADAKHNFDLNTLLSQPQNLSPNVLLRPLYQERILPNLCYIGGAGEISYWLLLKSFFEASNCTFPMLCVRNSHIFISEKNLQKVKKLKLEPKDLLLSDADLAKKVTKVNSDIAIDFSAQKKHLQQQFKALYTIADKTDASFIGAVAAQERKQIKGLEYLEKRLLKAQKRKLIDSVKRAQELKEAIFYRGVLQERTMNILELQTKTDASVIDYLQSLDQALAQSVFFIKY